MADILIAYSTVDGQTFRICERLRTSFEAQSDRVTLQDLNAACTIDIGPFDKIVIGASVRYGRHRRSVRQFVSRNIRLLRLRPCAFFSVNLEARKPGKDTPETNPYVRKFLPRLTGGPRGLGYSPVGSTTRAARSGTG